MRPKNIEAKLVAFERILTIMDELREKCPWDRKQTIESLRMLTIEEVFELADAITENDEAHVAEELGDILLHIVFYAKIGEERGTFDIVSIIDELSEKLIRRHPHIYGDVDVDTADEVAMNWEAIKLKEKGKSGRKSALEGVPRSLPALPKAFRIQQKAKKLGFEWENKEQVWEKVEEEMAELKEAEASGDKDHIEKEFGDVLFSLVNYARFLDIDPELALDRTNKKFINRFQLMEKMAEEKGESLVEMGLWEMDALWNETKKSFK